ncbi:hypothetical protein PYW08_010884 [Mythimna loreyi]|uniref:Uncharacterized protein n=1 Tax=Mythimna loreyi TaxID=667449 RepID=A0ACC2Q5D2_9NEOP|nr:hypothetical protein PYW08_010884 [Mythimna loreyi]
MLCVILLVLGLVYNSEANIKLSGSAMICKQVDSLTCMADVNLFDYPGQMVAYHQWNQVYSDNMDHFITKLGALKAAKTNFTIDLEKFDNNTSISNSFNVYNASNGNQPVFSVTLYCSGIHRKFIQLVDDGYYVYRTAELLKQEYYATKQVSFSCQEYSHKSYNVKIGWINTAGNTIFVFEKVETVFTLSAEHNGSMLCCIYFTATVVSSGINIRRFVKNKTLLIHQAETPSDTSEDATQNCCGLSNNPKVSRGFSPKVNETKSNVAKDLEKNSNTVNQIVKSSNVMNETGKNLNNINESGKTSNAAKESDKKSNGTKETDEYFNVTNELDKNSNATKETYKNSNATNYSAENSNDANEKDKYYNTTNEMGKNSNVKNITEPSSDQVPSYNSTIIISMISASILLLLVMISAIYKRCRRAVRRRDRSQRPLPPVPRQRASDEPDPNSPFYLNLLFRRECQLEIQAREEPQYEEVMYQ